VLTKNPLKIFSMGLSGGGMPHCPPFPTPLMGTSQIFAGIRVGYCQKSLSAYQSLSVFETAKVIHEDLSMGARKTARMYDPDDLEWPFCVKICFGCGICALAFWLTVKAVLKCGDLSIFVSIFADLSAAKM